VTYAPDGHKILFGRQTDGKTDLWTMNPDGSNLKQITMEEGTHWAPAPAPDGIHVLYVKVFPPHNFEIVLLNLKTLEEKRITYNNAFDGFPTFSPDGNLVAFSSSHGNKPGDRTLSLFLLDISSLHLGKKK
jgi:TolB protein